MNLNLTGKAAVITGGGGAIGGALARAFAAAGARVAIWDISEKAGRERAAEIGGEAIALVCDVSDRAQVEQAGRQTLTAFAGIDILVNAAGGSSKAATTSPELPFCDITPEALMQTMAVNYAGTVIASQVVGQVFVEQKRGVILNIASVGGVRPLTRAVAYSAAKAAVVSFTQWLAVHMAREYSPQIRVNALAPGFVLTDQNRFLLRDEQSGAPTERGRQVLAQVPMARYGQPEDMVGAALWLVSDAASYVTGAVVPVDGGLLALLGV
ncbi:MAG: SDR family oxidoreductase [Verrucomicrobia bacterium]|nr:SDR family oxidoreductase [Verrucomicrobiota bacterium]